MCPQSIHFKKGYRLKLQTKTLPQKTYNEGLRDSSDFTKPLI